MTSVGVMASSVVPVVGPGNCVSVLREPFDNLTAWPLTGGTTVSIQPGRTGTALHTSGVTNHVGYTIPVPNQLDYITFGFAYRRTDSAALTREVFRLYSDAGGTMHNKLAVSSTGALTITTGNSATTGGTSANGALPFVTNTWYYIEVQLRLHDTLGSAIVKVDGVTVINTSGVDTRVAGTVTVYEQLRLGNFGFSGPISEYDDLYLTVGSDCTFQGSQVVASTGYLTPTVGTVTTPDPGPLPNQYVIAWRARTATSGEQRVLEQWSGGGQQQWIVSRNAAAPGYVQLMLSSTGSDLVGPLNTVSAFTANADEYRALAVTLNNGSGTQVRTPWTSTDGTTWTVGAASTSSATTVFDATAILRVGRDVLPLSRIYSVEMRTDLDPAAGTVVWRFDAAEYPGTGLTYVDPRGRTWTLSTAGAITP